MSFMWADFFLFIFDNFKDLLDGSIIKYVKINYNFSTVSFIYLKDLKMLHSPESVGWRRTSPTAWTEAPWLWQTQRAQLHPGSPQAHWGTSPLLGCVSSASTSKEPWPPVTKSQNVNLKKGKFKPAASQITQKDQKWVSTNVRNYIA